MRHLNNKRVIKLGSYLLFCLFICGCGPSHLRSTADTAVKQENSLQKQTSSPQKVSLESIIGTNTNIAKVWTQFTKDGRYRLADSRDFRIPEWAINKFHLQAGDYEMPFITTSLGHAAIVVDSSRDDNTRFGLVIFSVDEGATEEFKEEDTIYWVYRNKDLSRTVLGGGMGKAGLYTVEYLEDYEYITCAINWDDIKKQYLCQNEQINKVGYK